jgi:hypothetical protein
MKPNETQLIYENENEREKFKLLYAEGRSSMFF